MTKVFKILPCTHTSSNFVTRCCLLPAYECCWRSFEEVGYKYTDRRHPFSKNVYTNKSKKFILYLHCLCNIDCAAVCLYFLKGRLINISPNICVNPLIRCIQTDSVNLFIYLLFGHQVMAGDNVIRCTLKTSTAGVSTGLNLFLLVILNFFPSTFESRSDYRGHLGYCVTQQWQAEVHIEDQPRLCPWAGDSRSYQEKDTQHVVVCWTAEDVCAGVSRQIHPQSVWLWWVPAGKVPYQSI